MFEDSTHQLWRCSTDDGEMMLKICRHRHLAYSACWQVMTELFGRYLPHALADIDLIQQRLEQSGNIPIPELIACGGQTPQWPAFMLNRIISGEMLNPSHITDDMVLQLAGHIAGLHANMSEQWGDLAAPQYPAALWPETLIKTLERQVAGQGVGEAWLSRAVSQTERITPGLFSPIMLDNRWDQYLFEAGKIRALVDIDAFVAGPRELELVLLEYQLDNAQAKLFADAYQKILPMPDLSQVRLSYRLLLFLMNALGEVDLDKWMQSPVKW